MPRVVPALLAFTVVLSGGPLPKGLRFLPGPVNGLLIGDSVLVYGDASSKLSGVRQVLFTHARRDVVWAGAKAVAGGASAVVPERERDLFERPDSFWKRYETERFHDYSQVNTKVLREPMRVSRAVKGGDVIPSGVAPIDVMDTPGYTRGAVSYWIETGGKRIACTGDLIYGDGRLFDLSSLQDEIPEAKTLGYHGYAARAGTLIESLRRIAARNPDVLVPARGPLITDPKQAIDRLIGRLQSLMASHFATDALLWYWGGDSLRIRSRTALDGRPVDSMPMADQRPLPPWALAIGNSRLLLSNSGEGFVIDDGYKGLRPKLDELTAAGRLKTVEGIWITHYHDDHTDYAQELADRYRSPVYFSSSMQDVLEHPAAYRLPCLTRAPIQSGKPQPDGARMRWHEFRFTFFDFPGQTLYHGGLLVERDSGGSLFFAGDSFTPSGIDDYCLQNRDFVHEDEGFRYCLKVLERLPRETWLVNQHVEPAFRFSAAQFARMQSELERRAALLAELSPWPDPNYEIDENWAAIHPYGGRLRAGGSVRLELRIRNHTDRPQTYHIGWNTPSGIAVVTADVSVQVPPHGVASAHAELAARTPGLHVVTADVAFAGQQLREWTEALLRVEP